MPSRPHFFDPTTLMDRTRKQEVITCEKCGCKWMELIMVQQYPKDHAVILGQKPPSSNDIGFWIFRCVKCSEIYEPCLISGGPQDLSRKGYDKFMDHMMKPDTDKRSQGEKV